MEDVEPIPMASGANLGRGNYLRPPAVVTEFMSQGSVKQALARKSEVVYGNMHRVVVAMDAAKVGVVFKCCDDADIRPCVHCCHHHWGACAVSMAAVVISRVERPPALSAK